MVMQGWFRSLPNMRTPRSRMAGAQAGWLVGLAALLAKAGSKPWVSRLTSSTTYRPYMLQSSYQRVWLG